MKRSILFLSVILCVAVSGCKSIRGWRAFSDASSAERIKQLEKQVELLSSRLERMEYELRFNVASNQVSIGKWEDAIKGFREVVNVSPDAPLAADSLYQIAKIYKYNLKNPTRAIETYGEILKRYPKSSFGRTAMFEIAESMSELGKKTDARVQYRQIVTKYPGDPVAEKAYFEIGDISQSEKNYSDARDAYQKVLEKFPAGSLRSAALYRLAVCSLSLSDTVAALRQYQRVYTDFSSSDFAELAYFDRASALSAENSDSAARADISDYLIRYPTGRYRAELERLLTKIDRKKFQTP